MGGPVSKCCGAAVRDGDKECAECGDSLMSDGVGGGPQKLDIQTADAEIKRILADLPPEQRAKLEAYMKAHPDGRSEVPDAKATGELRLWRDDGDLIGVDLDRKDVWLILYALEQVQEAGPFEEESYQERYAALTKKVFEAYRGRPS